MQARKPGVLLWVQDQKVGLLFISTGLFAGVWKNPLLATSLSLQEYGHWENDAQL